jgi:hypothetical protein
MPAMTKYVAGYELLEAGSDLKSRYNGCSRVYTAIAV